MRVSILAVSAAFLSVCVAQSKYCCTPHQWEGEQVETGGTVINGKAELIRGFHNISYDGINKKLSVMNYVETGTTVTKELIIQDFGKSTMYTIDLTTEKCVKSKIDFPWQPACVPDSAISVGPVVFGGGGNVLHCNSYAWTQTGTDVNLQVFVSVVKDGNVCYPVAEEMMGTANYTPLLETYGFDGITNGIKSPTVFVPPASCNQAPTIGFATRRLGFLGL